MNGHARAGKATTTAGVEESVLSVLPAVGDGDDAGAVLGDVEEHGHGEVEVRAGRVAPAAVVGGERVVWRAEVGGRDQDGGPPWPAPPPPGLLLAPDLEARAAAEPLVEQRRAQRRVVHAVPLAVQVAVPAGAAHGARSVAAAVERGVRALPAAAAADVHAGNAGGGGGERHRRGHHQQKQRQKRRRHCRHHTP
uniref:Uncharacterized protein n=1 Tax=Zea mays TaxID=4577 RepID=C0HI82_MAIZE|nr:unknown [Zea mays]